MRWYVWGVWEREASYVVVVKAEADVGQRAAGFLSFFVVRQTDSGWRLARLRCSAVPRGFRHESKLTRLKFPRWNIGPLRVIFPNCSRGVRHALQRIENVGRLRKSSVSGAESR